MSYRLRNRNKIPPGHIFPYVDEQTGLRITAGNYDALVTKVWKHRESNQLSPLTDETIDDNCCRQLIAAGHGQFCEDSEFDFVPVAHNLQLTLSQVLRGTLAIAEKVIFRKANVDQGEAERRAAICANCTYNVNPEDCTACNMSAIQNVVNASVGNARTSKHDQLKSCYWCSCLLRAKVWFPLDIVHRYTTSEVNASLPPFCWQKRV